MAKKYKVKMNGRDNTLSVDEQTVDENGMLQQVLKFNDDEIVIKEIEDNGSRRVVVDSKLSYESIDRLLALRAKDGSATQLEKVAYYQLEHTRSAEAEQIARLFPRNIDTLEWSDIKETSQWKNRKSNPSYKKINLSQAQIAGTEPLPDLDKEFPWRTSSIKFADGLLSNFRETNAFKRKMLDVLRDPKYGKTQDMIYDRTRVSPEQDPADRGKNAFSAVMRYDFALQDAKDKLGIEAPDDEGTERLVAAAKARENSKKEKTTSTPIKQDKDFDMG